MAKISRHRKHIRTATPEQNFWATVCALLMLIPTCRDTGRAYWHARHNGSSGYSEYLKYGEARGKFFATFEWLDFYYQTATGYSLPHSHREEVDFFIRLVEDESYRRRLYDFALTQGQIPDAPPRDPVYL